MLRLFERRIDLREEKEFNKISKQVEELVEQESKVIIQPILNRLMAIQRHQERAKLANVLIQELSGFKLVYLGSTKAAIYERVVDRIKSYADHEVLRELEESTDNYILPSQSTELKALCPTLFTDSPRAKY